MIAKKNETAMPEINAIQDQIKQLESGADATLYEKYKSMRKDSELSRISNTFLSESTPIGDIFLLFYRFFDSRVECREEF